MVDEAGEHARAGVDIFEARVFPGIIADPAATVNKHMANRIRPPNTIASWPAPLGMRRSSKPNRVIDAATGPRRSILQPDLFQAVPPRVARSMSMATTIMMPVARSW
jgi:hypothetical protein